METYFIESIPLDESSFDREMIKLILVKARRRSNFRP